MNPVFDNVESFGLRNFGHCYLGDPRRTRRLVKAADRILAHPALSLPNKFASPKDYRALLRLANSKELTHQKILRSHAQAVRLRLEEVDSDVILLAEDTTELDYSGQDTLALGQIGTGTGQGYQCHNTIAIDPDTREIYGLLDQILHIRREVPQGETVAQKRAHPDRESRLWVQAAQNVGDAPRGKTWIHVCDRGADTFEYLQHMSKQGKSFVVRSTHNRSLVLDSDDEDAHLLHDRLRQLPAQANWKVSISARPASKRKPMRTTRTAEVYAAAERIDLRAPHVRKGEFSRESVNVWGIRVWEASPPEGEEALEWVLLTDQEASSSQRLRCVVSYYECRPVVEEFHKCKKTGMGIELLQLQSRNGLDPMIGLLSVVAVAITNLRIAARDEEKASRPAEEYVNPLWVKVLSIWRYRQERKLTVEEFTLALGRLGGHQNRKCDGLPGWLTLWRGWERLRTMIDYEESRSTCGKH